MKRFVMMLLSVCLLVSCAGAEPKAETVRSGDCSVPAIAITVDDCYDRAHILAAIELCEKYEIKMTFIPIGKALKYADGSLWQRAIDAGCEIGNHTWGHVNLTKLTQREIRFQMLRTQQKIDQMLGYHYPMQVMRPPAGKTSGKVSETVASVGYRAVVKWNVSQTDAAKAERAVSNGSILLYHARAKDIRCLEKLIPALLARGYECVTVSELLGFPPVVIAGDIYMYEPEHALGQ